MFRYDPHLLVERIRQSVAEERERQSRFRRPEDEVFAAPLRRSGPASEQQLLDRMLEGGPDSLATLHSYLAAILTGHGDADEP
jgi:hypothetical protein